MTLRQGLTIRTIPDRPTGTWGAMHAGGPGI